MKEIIYVSYRDGVFAVRQEDPVAESRYDSSSRAIQLVYSFLMKDGDGGLPTYREYARGVNRLCPPGSFAIVTTPPSLVNGCIDSATVDLPVYLGANLAIESPPKMGGAH